MEWTTDIANNTSLFYNSYIDRMCISSATEKIRRPMQVHTVAQSPMATTANAQKCLYANYAVTCNAVGANNLIISCKHCLQPTAYYTWPPSQYPENLDQSTAVCALHSMHTSTATHSIIVTTVVSVRSASVSSLHHHTFTLLIASVQNTKFTSSHAYQYSSHSWINNKWPTNNPEHLESSYLHQGHTVEKCHTLQRWNTHGLLIYCVMDSNVISYEYCWAIELQYCMPAVHSPASNYGEDCGWSNHT